MENFLLSVSVVISSDHLWKNSSCQRFFSLTCFLWRRSRRGKTSVPLSGRSGFFSALLRSTSLIALANLKLIQIYVYRTTSNIFMSIPKFVSHIHFHVLISLKINPMIHPVPIPSPAPPEKHSHQIPRHLSLGACSSPRLLVSGGLSCAPAPAPAPTSPPYQVRALSSGVTASFDGNGGN